MNFTKITKYEQINRLKEGDQVIVCWSKESNVYKNSKKRVQMHKVVEVKKSPREVILSGPNNPYFGIKSYLLGKSTANSVSTIEI